MTVNREAYRLKDTIIKENTQKLNQDILVKTGEVKALMNMIWSRIMAWLITITITAEILMGQMVDSGVTSLTLLVHDGKIATSIIVELKKLIFNNLWLISHNYLSYSII